MSLEGKHYMSDTKRSPKLFINKTHIIINFECVHQFKMYLARSCHL